MLNIILRPVTSRFASAQSTELFTFDSIRGGRVRNQEYKHQITAYADPTRCCHYKGGAHLHMNAVPTVIASERYETAKPTTVHTVCNGEIINVDGARYRIVEQNRKLADPILIPFLVEA